MPAPAGKTSDSPAFGRNGKRQLDSSLDRRRGSMKWNIIIGTLVMGLGLCSQSFGFELLDRMLGVDSCCESSCCAKKSCCEAAAPSCGCDTGCNTGCNTGCCKPKCCRQPLFNFNRCCKPKCGCDNGCNGGCNGGCAAAAPTCEAAAPACGCETACAPKCCKQKCCGSILDRLFACHKRCCKPSCNSGCGCGAAPSCGCDGGSAAPAAPAMDGDAPPMPPAPVVDPSAFVPAQRRVVHASTRSIR